MRAQCVVDRWGTPGLGVGCIVGRSDFVLDRGPRRWKSANLVYRWNEEEEMTMRVSRDTHLCDTHLWIIHLDNPFLPAYIKVVESGAHIR